MKLWIWSQILKKSIIENFILRAVLGVKRHTIPKKKKNEMHVIAIASYILHEEFPNTEFFSGLCIPVFGLNKEIYESK